MTQQSDSPTQESNDQQNDKHQVNEAKEDGGDDIQVHKQKNYVTHSLQEEIFKLYSPRKRFATVLLIASAALMVPLTDTSYLPSLTTVSDSTEHCQSWKLVAD
jgi:hypothetical protein